MKREWTDLKALTDQTGMKSQVTDEEKWIQEIRQQVAMDAQLKAQLNLAFELKITPLQEREQQLINLLSRVKPQTPFWLIIQVFNPKLSLNDFRYQRLKKELESMEEQIYYWKTLKREAKRLRLI